MIPDLKKLKRLSFPIFWQFNHSQKPHKKGKKEKKSKTDTKASREKVTKIQAKTTQKAAQAKAATQKVAPAFNLVFEKKPATSTVHSSCRGQSMRGGTRGSSHRGCVRRRSKCATKRCVRGSSGTSGCGQPNHTQTTPIQRMNLR